MKNLMYKAQLIRSSRDDSGITYDVLNTHLQSPEEGNAGNEQSTNDTTFSSGIEAMTEPEQTAQSSVSLEELEMLSWVNWEAFVQNMNDSTN